MEHLQKIETKLIRRADGARLRLDYCLLLDAETGRCGLEVIFSDHLGSCRERFPLHCDSSREATALIHRLAFGCILPRAMLARLRPREKTGQAERTMV